jgi:hypothetical protein
MTSVPSVDSSRLSCHMHTHTGIDTCYICLHKCDTYEQQIIHVVLCVCACASVRDIYAWSACSTCTQHLQAARAEGGKEARRLTDARVLASHFAAMQVEYSAVSGAQREPDEEAAARWHGVVAVAGGAASSASAGGAAAGAAAAGAGPRVTPRSTRTWRTPAVSRCLMRRMTRCLLRVVFFISWRTFFCSRFNCLCRARSSEIASWLRLVLGPCSSCSPLAAGAPPRGSSSSEASSAARRSALAECSRAGGASGSSLSASSEEEDSPAAAAAAAASLSGSSIRWDSEGALELPRLRLVPALPVQHVLLALVELLLRGVSSCWSNGRRRTRRRQDQRPGEATAFGQ